jgi:hypothetical protein
MRRERSKRSYFYSKDILEIKGSSTCVVGDSQTEEIRGTYLSSNIKHFKLENITPTHENTPDRHCRKIYTEREIGLTEENRYSGIEALLLCNAADQRRS